MRSTLKIMSGLTLIGLGLIGILLPFMPGLPLVIGGIALVGIDHPWVRPVLERVRGWQPWIRNRKRQEDSHR